MGAFAVLYLVLPLPLAFCLNAAEELLFFRRWRAAHGDDPEPAFPLFALQVSRLRKSGAGAFLAAAAEELLLLLAVTLCVLMQWSFALGLWSAVFMAFSAHLFARLFLALVLRSYVPGVVSSAVLLPYAAYGIYSIYLVMSQGRMAVLALAGIAAACVNRRLAGMLGGPRRQSPEP